jgi:hypothetical protein
MARIDKKIVTSPYTGEQSTFYTVYRKKVENNGEETFVGSTYSEDKANKMYERSVELEEYYSSDEYKKKKEAREERERAEAVDDSDFEADGEGTEPDENVVGDNVVNQEDPVPDNAPEPETPKEETPTGSGNETGASGN